MSKSKNDNLEPYSIEIKDDIDLISKIIDDFNTREMPENEQRLRMSTIIALFEAVMKLDANGVESLKSFIKEGMELEQISAIAYALKEGVDSNKIELIAEPGLSVDKVHKTLDGILRGLTDEQLAYLVKPEHTVEEMEYIVFGFTREFTEEQISTFVGKDLTGAQLSAVFNAILNGLSNEELEICANPDFSAEIINSLTIIFRDKVLDAIK
jgi:hypothetical protein